MQRAAMHAATSTGARLVVLENLYSYGPTGGQTLTERLPARATSAKARTRIEMTNELLDAHRRGALDVTIGRASDFFGPGVTQSALGEQVFRPALTGRRAQVMGNPNLRHSYSYAPDVAAGLIALGTPRATSGEIWHLPIADTLTTREFIDAVYTTAGHPTRLTAAGRTALGVVGVFKPELKELRHTLYQFTESWVVDDTKFRNTFGDMSTPRLVSHRRNRPVVPKQPRKGSIMNRKLTAIALITAAVLTNAGFTALGSIFNYPDVLKEPTGEILDRFREHQASVSLWFAVLALSAVLFAPIAIGIGKLRDDRWMKLAVPVGIAAAAVQAIGLFRWPLLVPGFASDAASTNPTTAADARDHFDTAHTILGNVIGETFGYLLTAAWTLLVVASLGTRFAGRAFAALGTVSGTMILLGVLSPLDLAIIDTVNFAGYVLWSVWLIWLAVAVIRDGRSPVAVFADMDDAQPHDRPRRDRSDR